MTGVPNPKLDELVAVLARLRAPGGCAWDREQTHESLVRHLIEEAYELVDAIEAGSRDEIIEELGDVLYQVIFHADIAAHADAGRFDLEEVAARMTAKMIGRHPHVFGDTTAESADDVIAAWDELKAIEKPGRTSVLDGIPQAMPSLLLAEKLLGRADRVGVAVSGAGSRGVDADAGLARVLDTTVRIDTEHDLGRALLALVVSARERGLDAERALRGALRDLQTEIRDAE